MTVTIVTPLCHMSTLCSVYLSNMEVTGTDRAAPLDLKSFYMWKLCLALCVCVSGCRCITSHLGRSHGWIVSAVCQVAGYTPSNFMANDDFSFPLKQNICRYLRGRVCFSHFLPPRLTSVLPFPLSPPYFLLPITKVRAQKDATGTEGFSAPGC